MSRIVQAASTRATSQSKTNGEPALLQDVNLVDIMLCIHRALAGLNIVHYAVIVVADVTLAARGFFIGVLTISEILYDSVSINIRVTNPVEMCMTR